MNVYDRWNKLISETGLIERTDDKGMKWEVQQGFYKGILLATMNGYIHPFFEVNSKEETSPNRKHTEIKFWKSRDFRSRDKVETAIELVKQAMKDIDTLLEQGYIQASWYSLDLPENCHIHYDPEKYELIRPTPLTAEK